jgi:hypothetical protein
VSDVKGRPVRIIPAEPVPVLPPDAEAAARPSCCGPIRDAGRSRTDR